MTRVSAALLALAGCSAVPPASTPSLAGRWQVVAVNGQPAAGAADFAPLQFSIGFGCNNGWAQYRQDHDRLAIILPMAVTERACGSIDDSPSPVMQREQEGFRIASRPMRIAFSGPDRVRLANQAGTIDLSR